MPTEASIDTADIAEQLVARLRSYGPCAVAFSGGVDSAVVAMAAFLAHGHNAVAVTAVSPSLARTDRDFAANEAMAIGIPHIEVETHEFTRPEYRRNSGDRCFFCKDTLYSATQALLQSLPAQIIVNGANQDDLGDHRPGMQAAAQHRVKSPLIEEGLGKQKVRAIAAFWNLQARDKPAAPCLASRIAYGVEVTAERVARIEQAEAFLKNLLACDELRVRLEQAELARIELPLDHISKLLTQPLRQTVTQHLRNLGFRSVTLDLEGFRSGNLNALLVPLGLGTPSVSTALKEMS
jgi:uncharacterized protein